MNKTVLLVVVLLGGAVAAWLVLPNRPERAERAEQAEAEAPAAEPGAGGELRIYNWSDYIADTTISRFEQEYGIDVSYDVFDSNEVLEAKLLAGHTGFDIVVPSDNFLGRQIQAGVFAPIDKSRLSNYAKLDAELMRQVAAFDPGNTYGIPYLWGTTGIGYNPDKVKAALGEDAPVDSWDLVMKAENLEKLASCGVAFLDAPQEVIPIALNYLGEDPNSFDAELISGRALSHLLGLRGHITYLHSSKYTSDLANGDICVAVGWSGDVLQAADDAAEGVTVEYSIPKEGAALWFDIIAIPKDAGNIDNAHLFIDYLLRPEVIAEISNEMFYPNPNSAALEFVDEEIKSDPNIYPLDRMGKLFSLTILPPEIDRVYTDAWRSFSSGKRQ